MGDLGEKGIYVDRVHHQVGAAYPRRIPVDDDNKYDYLCVSSINLII